MQAVNVDSSIDKEIKRPVKEVLVLLLCLDHKVCHRDARIKLRDHLYYTDPVGCNNKVFRN